MIRTGIGYDVHAVSKGRPLMLGCVHFEDATIALQGHSDADVVSHAICDAILGAAGLGDIGDHFPDTEAQWKDTPGHDFLVRVAELVRAAGYEIINIDCTVLCDVVRLGDRKKAMAVKVAESLGVEPGAVNVKATTFEGKGAIGRGEAIGCEAIATLEVSAARMGEWQETAL
jgi:2-C-methyl-D-erythritol 2,4-cyclodiphosphate synthase